MSEMNRREALTLIALSPFAAGARPRPAEADEAHGAPPPKHKFFNAHEFATASVLADLILPADERSGSATQAGVPEYMDFILSDVPDETTRLTIRGGLAWLDAESRRRSGKAFVDSTRAQQTAILDDISWPNRVPPGLSHGAAFFNRFRDMAAAGFWSSKMGVADLQYRGNTVVLEWKGCPPEALRKLGLEA